MCVCVLCVAGDMMIEKAQAKDAMCKVGQDLLLKFKTPLVNTRAAKAKAVARRKGTKKGKGDFSHAESNVRTQHEQLGLILIYFVHYFE